MATSDSETYFRSRFFESLEAIFSEVSESESEVMPDPADNPTNSQVGTKRFELPAYNSTNPDLWFLTCEIIFEDYGVETEKKRFSAILQRLGTEQIATLESIIRQKPVDPYTQAKARLIAADGKSEEEKLNHLLRGADIPTGTKPCVILQKLRALVGAIPEADRLVRPIWLQKLPVRMQEILSANSSDPLDSVCKTADKLYELQIRSSVEVSAVAASASHSSATDDCLTAALRLLTSEIAALRADRREHRPRDTSRGRSRDRSRDRSYGRYSSRPRGRSQTPGRDLKPEIIDGLCWYHYTYGDRARNCATGCKRASQGNAN